MTGRGVLGVLGFFGVALVTINCATSDSRSYSSPSQATASPSPAVVEPVSSPAPSASTISIANSPIRSVDFDKVTYPDFPDYTGSRAKHVTLKAGDGRPSYVNFGDITGDGAEEAMVALSIKNRGSAIPYYVYIFTMENGKPKVIWAFDTGDRADGGLRQVTAENGQLVIELFGKDRVIGGEVVHR
jgi:hypothetical protein